MATRTSRTAAGLGAAVVVLALAACSGGSGDKATPGETGAASEGSTTAEITFWDPYPQREAGSPWDELVKSCAPEGSTITRTAAPQNDVFTQLTTSVKEGNPPDVVLLDNPMMPDAATAGLLATAEQAGLDTTGYDANLIAPGTVEGKAYGIPMGSNALGLYYNKDILDKAGVDPSSIKDWKSLNAAIEKVVASGKKGITFAGIAGEEGSFQFEPWFWGAGADLKDLGSDKAIAAGQLVSDWIGKGWAPRSAATDNQSASWDVFLTGEYGFAENGSWFAQAAADNKDFTVGMIPIPSKDGGVAPVPTGGEFAIAPLQKKDASNHYANAAAVIACLTSGEKASATSEALGYLSAKKDVRAEQVKSNDLWTPWVSIIEGAQGRTSVLGPDYVTVSAALSEAEQAALNAAGDAGAVKQAFQDAAGS